MSLLIIYSTAALATNINGRFVIVGTDNSKISILIQFNTNTGTDDLGSSTVVFGFDNTLLNLPNSPQRNVDYFFHNFSGDNYTLGTVTKPSVNMVWVNIDLYFNNSNQGTIVSQNPEWTDVVTINFDLINSTDSINIYWLTSSAFWGIYDGNNSTLWNTGQFVNFTGTTNFDTTPPELLTGLLLDPATLELTFSEPLEITTALNSENYLITNGINIQDVFISNFGDVVTLITTPHSNGLSYIVTAEDIADLSGNIISSQSNSAQYISQSDTTDPLFTNVTVLNNKTLTVKFSERIDQNSAANKNNYSISNNIGIVSAQLLPDSSGVTLKTARQNDNTQYTITVSNIKDRAGNTIYPNPSLKQYLTPKKGKGNPQQKIIQRALSNSWHQYFTPEKSIDGKGMIFPDSRWQSEDVMPLTVTYDVEEIQSFDSLRISFYKWESGRMFQYSVYTSADSITWQPVLEEIWSENSEWAELNIDSTETRYLKLLMLKSNQGPFASVWEVEMFGTEDATSVETFSEIPETFELFQNYPNPFNPSTKIKFTIPSVGAQYIVPIQLKVFDILGNEVATLVDEEKMPGIYEVEFNGSNFSSGVYLYRLTAGSFSEIKKLILLK
ncbi:MAG: discoidin domain-containing protein [Ignavibacteriaceae bacterium]|nr:discoidin domain-containing protein [Ignavibacteriaceae bacterium]